MFRGGIPDGNAQQTRMTTMGVVRTQACRDAGQLFAIAGNEKQAEIGTSAEKKLTILTFYPPVNARTTGPGCKLRAESAFHITPSRSSPK